MSNPTQRLANFLRTLFAVILLLLGGLSGAALAAPTTPTTDFTDNGDGTVTHKTTGLAWKRCAEGQTWTGSTCSGTATTYTWEQAVALTANFAGKGDWRLPREDELFTVVEIDNTNPAINGSIFPNTPSSAFWSGTVYAADSTNVRLVDFNIGLASYYGKSYSFYVRLVRGGQLLDSSGLYSPNTDFTDNGNGTVTHKKTGLSWKRCAEGQNWTGSSCSGTAQTYTWAQASVLTTSYAGGSDWRTPTVNELLTLIEWSKSSPAINGTIFPNLPNTSSSAFWSGTTFVAPTYARYVIFYDGFTSYANKTASNYVLLVRGGKSLGPSLHGPDCLFNWAEGYAPTVFSPAGSASQTIGTYYYRAYAKSGSYLASSNDGNLYYLDKSSGLLNLGPLTQWYATAGCQP